MSKLNVDEIRSADRSASDSSNVTFADDGTTAVNGGISNLMNVHASIPFATSTITQNTSTYVKIGLLNQTDRAYMPKKTGFSVDASTDEIIVANAGTYIMSSTTFTVGAASSRENQLRWIVKNDATPSAYNDGTLIQWWYYVNGGTSNGGGTTEYITSGTTSIVELAANDHLQLWGLAIYGTQTVSQNTDYGKSHVSFIKIK